MKTFLSTLLFLIPFILSAQSPTGSSVTLGTRSGNDTIPMVNLPTVDIYGAI